MSLQEEGLPPYDTQDAMVPKKKNWIYLIAAGVVAGIIIMGFLIFLVNVVLLPFRG